MSNPHNIVRTSDFDVNKVSFGEAKKTEYGGMQVRVSYDNGNFVYQTPKMRAPFGAFSSQMSENDAEKHYLELSFGGESSLVSKAHELFNQLDEKMLDVGQEFSQQWFNKKKMSRELAEDKYSSCVRRFKDPQTKEATGKYPDTFRVKIPKSAEGYPLVEVYDQHKERIEVNSMEELLELVSKGSYVKALVQCSNLWITQKYGMGWRLVQLQVFPTGQMAKYSFIDDEDEEEF